MKTSDRPMVNVYEPDADGVEVLVYRPMNDAELADWEAHKAAVVATDAPTSALRRALEQLDPEAPITPGALLELGSL